MQQQLEMFGAKLALEREVNGRCRRDKGIVLDVPLAVSLLLYVDRPRQGGRRAALVGSRGGGGIYRLHSDEAGASFQPRLPMQIRGHINTAFHRRFFVLEESALRYYLDESSVPKQRPGGGYNSDGPAVCAAGTSTMRGSWHGNRQGGCKHQSAGARH